MNITTYFENLIVGLYVKIMWKSNSMKDIKRKCSLIVDSSKFISN